MRFGRIEIRIAGQPVAGRRVDSNRFAAQRVDILRAQREIGQDIGDRAVAKRGVQRAIQAERQAANPMVAAVRLQIIQQHPLAVAQRDVALHHKARDVAIAQALFIANLAGSVVDIADVDVAGPGEVRVDGDADQPAVEIGAENLIANIEHRFGPDRRALDQFDHPRPLRDQDPLLVARARQKGHRNRLGKDVGDGDNLKPGRE